MDWWIVAAFAINLITVTNIVRSSYRDQAKIISNIVKKLFNSILKIFRNHRSIKRNPNFVCVYFLSSRGSFSSSHFCLRCFTWLLIYFWYFILFLRHCSGENQNFERDKINQISATWNRSKRVLGDFSFILVNRRIWSFFK